MYRVYRVLQLHPGWTVYDYWDAPGGYCDWALEFDRIEKQVARDKQERAANQRR